MDCFFVFEYTLSKQQSPLHKPALRDLKYTKININQTQLMQYQMQQNVVQFNKLDEDITESKVLFKKMLQHLIMDINVYSVNFMNVTLVCQDIKLFVEIIPRECAKRDLALPYVLTNYFDLKEHMRVECFCPYKKWSDIAQYMEICSVRQTQFRSQTEILEKILKRLHKDKKIPNTTQRFLKASEYFISQNCNENQKRFKYFRILGLPFKAFPAEIVHVLAPEIPQTDKEICFIYERDRFSGKGMIKIPQTYEKNLIQKNRMYIGSRYIELEMSSENQFERAKLRSGPKKMDISPKREHRQNYSNQRDSYRIGRRRSSSRSPPSHSRSRQKHVKRQDNIKRQEMDHRRIDPNPFEQNFDLNTGEYAIKVRGLPFVFSEWDVENMFSFYNIITGSVRLGIKPGTSLKNGQAVILMKSYSDAQKALDMNGFKCMGRYAEVKVIGKDQYTRYK